jgi:exopolysaccharide biosynthesis polyprenyl glycosylphosphotransferase
VRTERREVFAQLVAASDIATLLLSFCGAYWVREIGYLTSTYGKLLPFADYAWLLWVIAPTWIWLLRSFRLYEASSYEQVYSVLWGLVQVQCLGGLVLFSSMSLMKTPQLSRLLVQVFLGVSFTALATEKIGVKKVLDRMSKRGGKWGRRVLLVASESQARSYLRLLRAHPHWGGEVVGVVLPGGLSENGGGKPGYQRWASLSEALQGCVVDEVVAVTAWQDAPESQRLARDCTERGITFRGLVIMPQPRVGRSRLEDVGDGMYLLSLETVPQQDLRLLIKRLLDIVGALVGLAFCGIACLWYARKIRRESPGPLLFCQQRVGQNGRRFTLYKFRTMYCDAEQRLRGLLDRNQMRGNIFKIRDDPRVTPVGRGLRNRHLDELPQFWNVLAGDMSLVGTRPPVPNEVAQYRPHHFRRLSMKPGITGLWQLNGNGIVSNFEHVVKLDCHYIDHWSLWLDCKILAKTVVKVARGGGW